MSEIEKDNLFEGMVNEAAQCPSASQESPVARVAAEAEEVKNARPDPDTPKYDYWAEVRSSAKKEYRKIRIKGFFRALTEIGGYTALGGVLLAAMLLDIVPAYAAVPVFTVSWIWSAIRMDRFFRR